MKKINKDKFRKVYTREYSRVFSKPKLENELATLLSRVSEIEKLLSEMKDTKEDHDDNVENGNGKIV